MVPFSEMRIVLINEPPNSTRNKLDLKYDRNTEPRERECVSEEREGQRCEEGKTERRNRKQNGIESMLVCTFGVEYTNNQTASNSGNNS